MRIFLLESLALCLLFTLLFLAGIRVDQLSGIGDYPPAVQNWARAQGLIPMEPPIRGLSFYLKKTTKAVAAALLLAVMISRINHPASLLHAFCIGYGLWLVVDFFDLFVVDWIFCTHLRQTRIAGSEDMSELYRDYGFHWKMSLRGMLSDFRSPSLPPVSPNC